MAQQPLENVKHNHRAGVAQMGAIVNRRAADIHPHIIAVQRLKGLFFAGLGVVQFDRRHKASFGGVPAGFSNFVSWIKDDRPRTVSAGNAANDDRATGHGAGHSVFCAPWQTTVADVIHDLVFNALEIANSIILEGASNHWYFLKYT